MIADNHQYLYDYEAQKVDLEENLQNNPSADRSELDRVNALVEEHQKKANMLKAQEEGACDQFKSDFEQRKKDGIAKIQDEYNKKSKEITIDVERIKQIFSKAQQPSKSADEDQPTSSSNIKSMLGEEYGAVGRQEADSESN